MVLVECLYLIVNKCSLYTFFVFCGVIVDIKYSFNRTIDYFKTLDKRAALKNNIVVLALIAFVIFTAIVSPRFLSHGMLFRLLNRIGLTLTMALGMSCIMIVGGTDLSAGRVSGLVGLVSASLLQQSGLANEVFVGIAPIPTIFPLLLAMAIGALVGIVNAFVIIKFRLHPFIMTLATGMIVYSLMFWYMSLGTNANKPITAGIDTDYYKLINTGIVVAGQKINYFVIVVFALAGFMWILYNKTPIGRSMYAVGCNRDAAQVTGISILKTTLICFGIAGALFGIAGFINGGYSSNNLDSGYGLDLDAIAACIIGGVSFAGGVGKISGVIMGVLLINLIQLALVFLRVDTHYTSLVSGLIIILAVGLDMQKSRAMK